MNRKSENQTLLLLHGLNEHGGIFDGWQDLKNQIHCVTPDLPPFGSQSEFQPKNFSMGDYAAWLNNEVEKQRLSRFSILGHSMGGYIGLEFLKQFPQKVEKLILLNSTILSDSPERRVNRNRTIACLRSRPESYYREFINILFKQGSAFPESEAGQSLLTSMKKTPVESLVKVLECLRDRADYTEIAQKYADRILWIGGAEDSMMPAAEQQVLAQLLGICYHSIPGAGHMSPWEAPKIVQELVLEFL